MHCTWKIHSFRILQIEDRARSRIELCEQLCGFE